MICSEETLFPNVTMTKNKRNKRQNIKTPHSDPKHNASRTKERQRAPVNAERIETMLIMPLYSVSEIKCCPSDVIVHTWSRGKSF